MISYARTVLDAHLFAVKAKNAPDQGLWGRRAEEGVTLGVVSTLKVAVGHGAHLSNEKVKRKDRLK